MRGFHNILQILSQSTSTDYSAYFGEVRTELYNLFNKYETNLVQSSPRQLQDQQVALVREELHGEKLLVLLVSQV
jgi:hypothetical protein